MLKQHGCAACIPNLRVICHCQRKRLRGSAMPPLDSPIMDMPVAGMILPVCANGARVIPLVTLTGEQRHAAVR